MVDVAPGSPDFWLGRLMHRLGERQDRFAKLDRYARGEHDVPDGDRRYVRALSDLQKKAKTNYIGLVLKAVTQRMRVKEFKFQGEVDQDAGRFWKANHMELQSAIAIADAAKFSESYTLVSPPDEESNGIPVITVEDPRNCIVENDPVRPLKRLAGLKVYIDDIIQQLVAVLYLPDQILVYYGPKTDLDMCRTGERIAHVGSAAAGFKLIEVHDNPIGVVPLVRGVWQPESGLAECEDGAFEIQDRINYTMLKRLIIAKSQAYRQRLIAGAKIPQTGPNKGKPQFDPGADLVWVVEDPNTKVFDLQQADIKQLLEAIRDDIGDLAALTQTPVTYLTAHMVNVSGDTLHAAQHSHVAKVRRRMDSMGWYFENVIKLCFQYLGDAKAQEVDAECHWADPEVRTMAEMADLVAKFNGIIPLELIMERVGFTADEIKRAISKMEEEKAAQQERDLELAERQAAIRAAGSRIPQRSGGGSSGSGDGTNSPSGSGSPKGKPGSQPKKS